MKDFYKKLHETQDYNPQLFEIHLYPAVFVSWNINYESSNPIATIVFRLAYEQIRDFSSISANKNEALKFLDFIAITDKVIKTIESKNTSKLMLANEELNIEETVVDVFTLTYRCNYYGKSKKPQCERDKGMFEDIDLKKQLIQKLL